VDADGQVRADRAQRGRRVQVAAWQVEGVTGAQHRVDHRLALGGGGHRGGPVVPRLGAQRVGQHRLVDRQCFSPAT
jgi:hypothetical protein